MNGQKKIYNLYALFGISIVLSVIPSMTAILLSVVFFLWVLIAAYVARGNAEELSLIENHATFIIRTLWITAFFSLMTTGAASAYMFTGLDYSPFESCVNAMAGLDINAVEQIGYAELIGYTQPCIDDFIDTNRSVLYIATAIAGGPLLAYLAYRFIKGLSRAMKGYRLADVRNWL